MVLLCWGDFMVMEVCFEVGCLFFGIFSMCFFEFVGVVFSVYCECVVDVEGILLF